MIELIDFNKSYSSKKDSFSVKNINLKIEPGKITGLLGPNGSGKSTIMNSICGFIYPTSGKISISDNDGVQNISFDVSDSSGSVMEYIGYVPEISKLPPDMTVLEFLIYVSRHHQLKDEKKAVKDVVKKCSLEKLLTKKIKTLSKGQQQRVSFAQALIHNPPNLILDEPISGLDPSQIKQIRTLIKSLSETKAILLSTHILGEAEALCSDVYIMNNGKMCKAENLSNLEEEYLEITENETE